MIIELAILILIMVELGFTVYDRFLKKRIDLSCDGCQRVMPLKKVDDFYLCRSCRRAYKREVQD